jgi:hypothetical protein
VIELPEPFVAALLQSGLRSHSVTQSPASAVPVPVGVCHIGDIVGN